MNSSHWFIFGMGVGLLLGFVWFGVTYLIMTTARTPKPNISDLDD